MENALQEVPVAAAIKSITLPDLNAGEIYIGCIGDATGNAQHIILLPGDNDDDPHQEQLDWAKSIGGDLPTRIEQAMLWANHRGQFKKDLYWSNELYEPDSGYAWCQYFDNGHQDSLSLISSSLRARAVRRLPV